MRSQIRCLPGWVACALVVLLLGPQAGAQEADYLNVPMPTMGGQQFWTDYRWAGGWRVQRNWLTDHWRVLDNSDIRRAWGSRQACLARFQEHVGQTNNRQPDAALPAQKVVLLLHGLMRSSDSMQPLAAAVAQQQWQGVLFSYASTQASIDEHARALRELVDNLPGQPPLALVGHSLGNIVARRAIKLWQEEGDPHRVLERLEQVVMLGPPNQGSSLAKYLSGLGLFEKLTGTSGQELGASWQEFQAKLATPPCPFMIVAGDVSQASIQNPLLTGQNDFIVTVDETRLEGAVETRTVPVLHAYLMSDSQVIEEAVKFIRGQAGG